MTSPVVRPAPVSLPEPADTAGSRPPRGYVASDLGPTVLLVVAALALAFPSTLARWASGIAVVGILGGVPHGAVDHLIPWWSTTAAAADGRTRRMTVFLVLYAASAAAVLALLLVAPAPALTVLLLLAAVHFGRGEVVAWAARAGRPAPRSWSELLPASAHGGVVVGALLWGHPTATGPVLHELSPQLATWAVQTRTPGLLLLIGVVLLALLDLAARARVRDAVDLVVLSAAFALAPPLVVFGCYFGGWHAVRHTDRLLDLARDGSTPDTDGRRAAARRLATAALLPTAAALATAAVLWWGRSSIGLGALIAVLLALTVPHAGVVAALDRRDRARPDPQVPLPAR